MRCKTHKISVPFPYIKNNLGRILILGGHIMLRLVPILFLVLFPMPVSAEKLIISEDEINETIISDHFSIETTDNLFINWRKLNELMDRLDEQVFKEPKNASIDEQGKIIPEELGVRLDRMKFISLFQSFFYGKSSGKITTPKKNVYPKVDSELLSEIRTSQLSSYETYYKESNKERTNNIELAAEAINNFVLFPGETFSFNNVVGKRTQEKGYMRAPVIVKGELSEDIGGGICQVSSTLYNAVILQGIEIIERYSHSREVPYVPPGKDATVSWWGPDFVFKNRYSHPILIRAKAENGSMFIEILSSIHVKEK